MRMELKEREWRRDENKTKGGEGMNKTTGWEERGSWEKLELKNGEGGRPKGKGEGKMGVRAGKTNLQNPRCHFPRAEQLYP